MNLSHFQPGAINWSNLPASEHPGETGTATMRTQQLGEIQLRLITYSPNYFADHWCHKGHIVFVVSGQLKIELQAGPIYTLTTGMSYHVADNSNPPHRVLSGHGATVFIVD